MFRTGQRPFIGFWRRATAIAGAALVFALTVLAASPAAHGWLHHGHDPAPEEDGCAVVLYAGGLTASPDPIDLPRPSPARPATAPEAAVELWLVTPRYLRQPERGPPQG